MTRHPDHSEDCPKGDFGHCDHWYDGGRCCHCQGPKANPDERETPKRLSLVGKKVRLKARPEEDMPAETLEVTADYELKKPDGFERFIQGLMEDGEYTETTYDDVEAVLG
jgi:hypothetical protein